jgi:hypothetical protein
VAHVLDIIEAEKELAQLRAHNELVEKFGLLGYVPHEKQDAFHRANAHKRRYVRTGNRFGKSTMGAAEDCAWALGYRPWYPEGDPARYEGIPQKSNSILILVVDWDKAEEIFTNEVRGQKQGKLFKLLPEGSYTVKKNQSGKIAEVRVKSKWGGESVICLDTVQSYKSNPMGQESSDWDAIHVDEPIPREMWIANARGLVDRNGSAWFTCTPLTEMWINDMFEPEGTVAKSVNGAKVTTQLIEEEGCGKVEVSFWMIEGSMHDNPNFGGEQKARFIAELTEDERETRISGRPSALQGVIYKSFIKLHWSQKNLRGLHGHLFNDNDTRKAGWTSPSNPPLDYCVRLAIDTHPSTPHAVLFCATAPSGHTYFYTEIFEHVHPRRLALMCMGRLDDVEIPDEVEEYALVRQPMRVLLEQAAYNKTPFDGMTMADEIIQAGLPLVEPAVKDLSYGILKVNQELAKTDDKGIPLLLFHEDLYETLREFHRYVWDPKTGKPVDHDDHMMENLYRLVVTGLPYIDPLKFETPQPKPIASLQNYKVDLTLPQERPTKPSTKNRYRVGMHVRTHRHTRNSLLYRGSSE